MASDAGPTAGGEAAPVAPQPTHIDVHLHQESGVKLLLSKCSLLSPGAPGAPRRSPAGRLLVASWVVQIVLGILSGVLGGLLYLGHYSSVRDSGAAIWTGAVAVLAGAVAFIYEKRGGICWALLRTLLALAAFTTAITAIAIGSANFRDYVYFYRGDFCYRDSWRGWPTESPSTDSPAEEERMQLCRYYVAMGKLWSLVPGLLHKPRVHALGGVGSAAPGISDAPVSALPEETLLHKGERPEETGRREWNLACLSCRPGTPSALGVPASGTWKKRCSNSAHPTATAMAQPAPPPWHSSRAHFLLTVTTCLGFTPPLERR
ncbi:transmembrane protein 176A isoform X1 [Talpa occidentalis]|uniref:transmembrane protein 176A-like isoform X1 n=1 Tax=Talpa occidentalis TaxID=50954 RepID=UPI00188EE0E7|nr:transmembrane protein 176A-like isoform X1 [Talpa occidentalis]XP_037371129.1 transmembrane protein 176A-like isoform X1 [Talpa occidentalis]XP_037371431.1 transmembrane protein 176A isoform X1 [Talpa occidentalis]XP_037371439.1 transmembrane protein 176A isoform X1 [Talpa occidentalis]